MSVWDDIVGQDVAIAMLRRAAAHPEDASVMTHAWLITGPAGSGRSTLALAFAKALESGDDDESDRHARLIEAGTHPDVQVLSTAGVLITIADVRDLVARAQLSPSMGRFRVQIIEDADRMTETTSNVLLKALEEPPAGTVWVLCCPSDADVLPTIRSRVRTVRLVTPDPHEVAKLLQRKWGVAAPTALECAQIAQCHVGMARRLATDGRARERRRTSLGVFLAVDTLAAAMAGARTLLEIATADAEAGTAEQTEAERAALLRQLGLRESDPVPPGYRAQLHAIEKDQKRQAKRAVNDGVDRVLTDAFSMFRDVLLRQLGVDTAPINVDLVPQIGQQAAAGDPLRTLRVLDAIGAAREQLARNVSPQLVLEALLAGLL